MLKSALVAMTILGCDCDQKTCEYVRTADLSLASVADCQARMRGEIENTKANYPLVVAICENLPQPVTTASASAVPDAPDMAQQPAEPARRTILVRARERYSEIIGTTRDGLGTVVEFVTVPAGWLERQISAVSGAGW